MSLTTLTKVAPVGLPWYGGWFRFSCKEPVGEVARRVSRELYVRPSLLRIEWT